ncbi:MAG: hypothetical protein ACKKL4_00175 [Patescibacteria group bacterium]
MSRATIIWYRNLKYITIIIVIIVGIIMLLMGIINLYGTYQEASSRYHQAQIEQELLIDRKEELEERNNLLNTPTGKRDFLVERKAMISKGERVLILVEDDRLVSQEGSNKEVVDIPWWRWWAR